MIKNMNELNKKFDSYGFRDAHGHDLLACVDFQELVRDAETLRKARAVLAEHGEMIESAREFAAYYAFPANPWVVIAELADALGGEV